MENLSYIVNNKKIHVQIKRTNNKNMYLRVKNHNLVVSAPFHFQKKQILHFIEKNIQKFASYIDQKKAKEFFDPSQGSIYIKGNKFHIVRMTGFSRPRIELALNNIIIKTQDGNNALVTKTIKKFLKEITKTYILKRQRDYETLMDVPAHIIKVSHNESTWGSNYIDKNQIIYASKLGHYPEKVLDYVIVHELAHYKYPNHSQEFWNEIKLYMPNYKEIKKILKANTSMEEH